MASTNGLDAALSRGLQAATAELYCSCSSVGWERQLVEPALQCSSSGQPEHLGSQTAFTGCTVDITATQH